MILRRSHLAGLLAAGLALTACSSSGGNAGGSTPPPIALSTPVTTSATSSAPATVPATTQASSAPAETAPSHDALAGIVVRQSDLPGYTPKPATPEDSTILLQLVSCVGSTGINPADKIEEVQSDDFVQGQVTVSSDATSYKSQAAVDALTALIKDPKAKGCLEQLLKQQVETTGATVNSVSLEITPNQGPPTNVVALLKGSISVTAQGQKATLNVAQAFITGRQLAASVSVRAINAQPDLGTLADQTVIPVATRAAAA